MFKYFQQNNIEKVFIVAELSANHNGSIETARQSIIAAKKAGANAIKLQTYTPDTITINSNEDDFIIEGTIWKAEKKWAKIEKEKVSFVDYRQDEFPLLLNHIHDGPLLLFYRGKPFPR